MQILGMPSAEKDTSIKKAAARLVRQLPSSASWDDLMHEILVRQKIESGLADLRDGRNHDHASIRSEFGVA
jgi:Tfp pilus assembly protein PilO